MRWSTLSVAIAGVVLMACSRPELTRQQRVVEQQFVQDRVTQWTQALNNKELDSLAAMYDQSPEMSVVWIEGHKTIGPEAYGEMIQDFYGRARYMNFALQTPIVEVLTPTVAVVTFRHSVDVQWFDTRRDVWAGYGTLVLRKNPAEENAVWKIHTQHVSVNLPR
jgi:ketosteroid isomerase-like protein